jgi:hypothetical protein
MISSFEKVFIHSAISNFTSAENDEEAASAIKEIASLIKQGSLIGCMKAGDNTISIILHLKPNE